MFNILKANQKEQYIVFRKSDEAKEYREKRNIQLPYVDFNNLPKIFDNILLEKIMLYQKTEKLEEQ